MISKTWMSLLGVVAISATMLANAQAPRNETRVPIFETFALYPSKDPKKLREVTIQQSGVNNYALRLSTEQKAEISKIIDAFVAELLVLQVSDPIEQGKRVPAAAVDKRQVAVGKLNSAVTKLMSTDQRKTWDADKATRRSALERRFSGNAQPGQPDAAKVQ
jgi:hypothetical protein